MIRAGETPLAALFDGGAEVMAQAGVTMEQLSDVLTEDNIQAMSEILHNVRDITRRCRKMIRRCWRKA